MVEKIKIKATSKISKKKKNYGIKKRQPNKDTDIKNNFILPKPKKRMGRKLIKLKQEKALSDDTLGNKAYFLYVDSSEDHRRIMVTSYPNTLAEYLNKLNKDNNHMNSFVNSNKSIIHFAWKKTFISKMACLSAFTIKKGDDTPAVIFEHIREELELTFKGSPRYQLLDNISKTTIYK